MSQQNESTPATTIEAGTQLKGSLEAAGLVIVRGTLEGELIAPALQIAEHGRVAGHVLVQSLRSAGALAGRIEADEVELTGAVQDDTLIRAKTLEVKTGVTFGACVLEIGADPRA